jgi:hypothetical protein
MHMQRQSKRHHARMDQGRTRRLPHQGISGNRRHARLSLVSHDTCEVYYRTFARTTCILYNPSADSEVASETGERQERIVTFNKNKVDYQHG